MQIFVMGMHRSGTSLLTRVINMMGAYCGPEHLFLGADTHNSSGYWERQDVVRINEQLLELMSLSWYAPGHEDLAAITIPDTISKIISRLLLGIDAHRPWIIKDPRMCLTLPVWRPHLELPVAVVCSRHPKYIAQSLCRRNRMPLEYGVALWERYSVSCLRAVCALPKIFVRHEEILESPVEATTRLHAEFQNFGCNMLRLPSSMELLAYIHPQYKGDCGAGGVHLSSGQQAVYAMMRGDVPISPAVELTATTRKLLAQTQAGSFIG